MDALVKSATRLEASKYVDIAASNILIFDYFLTFGMEGKIELIWKANWGLGKILFLFTRYPCFVDTGFVLYDHFLKTDKISHKTCLLIDTYTDVSAIVGIGVAEAIVVLRTYALWERSRRVGYFFLVLYIGTFIPAIVILVIFIRSLRYGEPPLPTVRGCFLADGSEILFVDYALLMLFETVIMVLTGWVGIKRYRHSSNRLITTLYRDGIFYYVYLFLVSAANVITLLAGPPEYADLFNSFQRIMHSVLSARITLHMREYARVDGSHDATLQSSLLFRSVPQMATSGGDRPDIGTGLEMDLIASTRGPKH